MFNLTGLSAISRPSVYRIGLALVMSQWGVGCAFDIHWVHDPPGVSSCLPDRPTSWDDFTEQPGTNQVSAETAVQFRIIHWQPPRLQVQFDPGQSWVNPEVAVPWLLRHEQLHFAISCLLTRQANAALNTGGDPEAMLMLLKAVATRINIQYDVETHHGLDSWSQRVWERAVQGRLSAGSLLRERTDTVLVSNPKDTEGVILRGQSLIHEKEFQEGIRELQKAIELDPRKIQTYIALAQAYIHMKDLPTAERTLQDAIQVDPRSGEARGTFGDVRFLMGKPQEAEGEYKRALEIDPDSETIHLKLAQLYQRMGKWTEAEAIYKKLVVFKPNNENQVIRLGDYYKAHGEQDKAMATYQRAVELNAKSSLARGRLIGHSIDIGKLTEAEQQVQAILKKNDRDLVGVFFDARLRLARGRPDEAIPLLQRVTKEEPSSARAHQFLGLAFAQTNDIHQAITELSEAVKLDPQLTEARTVLVALHLANGSVDFAIEEAGKALWLNPLNVRAAAILADAYLRKGDLRKSKEVYQALGKVLPNEAVVPYRLGLIARVEKHTALALAYFEQALAANPHASEPLAQIVAIEMEDGKLAEARARVTRQLQSSPNNPLLYNLLGRLWLVSKDVAQAEIAFKRAIELNPTLPISYMNLGELYHRTGNLDRAALEYEEALVRTPTLVPALMLRGMIHEQRREYDKARGRYEDALRVDPTFAPAANNLAWILIEQGGNRELALSYAQTAFERHPEDPYIADTLGWIYYKKMGYLKAIELLRGAAEKLPDNPVVQYHLGMAQYKNGDGFSAKKTLESALKLNPTFPGADEARKALNDL